MSLKKYLVLLSGVLCSFCFAENLAESVGFKHCGLIYHTDKIAADAEYFKPMLVKYEEGNPTNSPGFDAYLFLYYSLPDGTRTEMGTTDMKDWKFILSSYFSKNVDVPALNSAVGELKELGFIPADKKINVMVAVPWLHPDVSDFGDVDHDKVSENLANAQDRQEVIRWYMGEVAKRMKRNPNLNLWGFYLMREGMSGDNMVVGKEINTIAHELGYKTMWIPYYNAPSREKWKEAGFDVAFLQSNWTFRGQDVRINRLLNAGVEADRWGMGVELELSGRRISDRDRQIFHESLQVAYEQGFNLPVAYYFNSEFLYMSEEPEYRELYSAFMDYLGGRAVVAPQPGSWSFAKVAEQEMVIDYKLNQSTTPVAIEVITQESTRTFSGSVTVEGRNGEDEEFQPLAWRLYPTDQETTLPYENLTLTLPEVEVNELRVSLHPNSSEPIMIYDVLCQVDQPNTPLIRSKNLHKPYSTNQVTPPTIYPDSSGRELLDGNIGSGSWGEYVGWQHHNGVDLWLELPQSTLLDQIKIHLLEYNKVAIYTPDSVSAIITNDQPMTSYQGFGSMPEIQAVVHNIDFKLSDDHKSITATLPEAVEGQFISLLIDGKGWLFLSEVELYNQNKLVDNSKSLLTYRPLPSVNLDGVRYFDNNRLLSDGYVSRDYTRGSVGFNGQTPHVILLDLGKKDEAIGRVDCHIIDGHVYGIGTPKKILVSSSNDMKTWSEPISLSPEIRYLKNPASRLISVDTAGMSGRYVMITLEPSNYYTFISEIAIY